MSVLVIALQASADKWKQCREQNQNRIRPKTCVLRGVRGQALSYGDQDLVLKAISIRNQRGKLPIIHSVESISQKQHFSVSACSNGGQALQQMAASLASSFLQKDHLLPLLLAWLAFPSCTKGTPKFLCLWRTFTCRCYLQYTLTSWENQPRCGMGRELQF